MKVLLDHNVPAKLGLLFPGHEVSTAREMTWDRLRNGELMRAAEAAKFDVLLTADQSIFYQQNNRLRLIALVVLSTNDWAILRQHLDLIHHALERAETGSFELLTCRVWRAA